MASLKGRLQRLRELGLSPASALTSLQAGDRPVGESAGEKVERGTPELVRASPAGPAFLKGWDEVAPHVWMRSVEYPLRKPQQLDPAAWASGAVKSPAHSSKSPIAAFPFPIDPCAYSFFDFETTGLSGGAGTIPFLAAVGFFLDQGGFIATQLFIDDYPGEPEFLGLLLGLLGSRAAVVTYNGKAFDMPLLRTRCIMNGIGFSEPPHIDALHAARRLWKRTKASCSLKNLEVEVLDMDRGEDVPGSAIPALWLDFVAGRGEGAMSLVCSHNASDILSLARLFLRIDRIHSNPFSPALARGVDLPRLALWLWRSGRLEEALELLEDRAADGDAEAGFLLYRILRREGRRDEAIAAALALGDSREACVVKAMVCEHLLRDPEGALGWTLRAADSEAPPPFQERGIIRFVSGETLSPESLARRKARLERKLARLASGLPAGLPQRVAELSAGAHDTASAVHAAVGGDALALQDGDVVPDPGFVRFGKVHPGNAVPGNEVDLGAQGAHPAGQP